MKVASEKKLATIFLRILPVERKCCHNVSGFTIVNHCKYGVKLFLKYINANVLFIGITAILITQIIRELFKQRTFSLVYFNLHCVANVYAVWPVYDVKCLCSGGRE